MNCVKYTVFQQSQVDITKTDIHIASDKIQRMMKFNHALSNIKTKARFAQRYDWRPE